MRTTYDRLTCAIREIQEILKQYHDADQMEEIAGLLTTYFALHPPKLRGVTLDEIQKYYDEAMKGISNPFVSDSSIYERLKKG